MLTEAATQINLEKRIFVNILSRSSVDPIQMRQRRTILSAANMPWIGVVDVEKGCRNNNVEGFFASLRWLEFSEQRLGM